MTNYEKQKQSLKTEGSRVFARGEFNKLVAALANDTNHETKVMKTKQGEKVEETTVPAAAFRKDIHNVLLDFGVDKQEAEPMLTGEYQFKKLDGVYDLATNAIMDFAEQRAFTFPSAPDMAGMNLVINHVEAHDQENNVVGSKTGEKVKSHVKAHRKGKLTSKTPSWLRERL